jgi:hypothetical protein
MPKKIICFCLIVSLFFLLTGSRLFSAPPELEPWAENLNLTSDQAQALKTLQGQFRQELIQIQKKIMLKWMEFKTLSVDDFKGEKGNEFRRQIQDLMLQARERSLVYRQEAHSLLTLEQQKKLPAESELGFHCRGWFLRGGMRRGPGKGPSGMLPSQDPGLVQP